MMQRSNLSSSASPSSSLQSLLISFVSIILIVSPWKVAESQALPPPKYDGFVYQPPQGDGSNSIMIEAFFDPVCPDSRDSWPPLKQAVHFYGPRVWLLVHLLPLPYFHMLSAAQHTSAVEYTAAAVEFSFSFKGIESGRHRWSRVIDSRYSNCRYHDNAYAASRALHIVNLLNSSYTFPLLEEFFKYQGKFYNDQTKNLSRVCVVNEIVRFAAGAIGNSYYPRIEAGFNDRQTDLITRVSFKYSTSRGVYGTPTFFVNGFVLPDAGSTIDYQGWTKIIDPLIRQSHGKSTDR